jgi:hypothetical protein
VERLIIHPKDMQSESSEPSDTIRSSGRCGAEVEDVVVVEEERECVESSDKEAVELGEGGEAAEIGGSWM